jgi:CheY-like chemotaxis protein
VLLVEDNDAVRNFAEQLLEDMHCPTVSAASGEDALELLDREQVDLVFSDIVMPGMSGIDLAKRLGELQPGLPVLLASGYSDEILRGEASEFQLLRKPYGADDLRAAMEAALSGVGKAVTPA